ncbi:PqqD family protein [Pseudoprevotella muciniphila]|uniref:PqqD family protein n=1 Tax=Pseudoprevotella muciniphila TaxID=2133944 RepID=A0A5P8E588_9BACT|nr:PqqD family protein [Pseudoprevotella muciniphila]QFQ12131.1 PqqD family protein [Pseudoprevotella muciniphila]
MKKKTGFQVRDIAGEKVLVAYGLENIDFSKMVSLNETACFIWELIEPGEEIDVDKLTTAVMNEYEIDSASARKDIEELLEAWKEEGLME